MKYLFTSMITARMFHSADLDELHEALSGDRKSGKLPEVPVRDVNNSDIQIHGARTRYDGLHG